MNGDRTVYVHDTKEGIAVQDDIREGETHEAVCRRILQGNRQTFARNTRKNLSEFGSLWYHASVKAADTATSAAKKSELILRNSQ